MRGVQLAEHGVKLAAAKRVETVGGHHEIRTDVARAAPAVIAGGECGADAGGELAGAVASRPRIVVVELQGALPRCLITAARFAARRDERGRTEQNLSKPEYEVQNRYSSTMNLASSRAA